MAFSSSHPGAVRPSAPTPAAGRPAALPPSHAARAAGTAATPAAPRHPARAAPQPLGASLRRQVSGSEPRPSPVTTPPGCRAGDAGPFTLPDFLTAASSLSPDGSAPPGPPSERPTLGRSRI